MKLTDEQMVDLYEMSAEYPDYEMTNDADEVECWHCDDEAEWIAVFRGPLGEETAKGIDTLCEEQTIDLMNDDEFTIVEKQQLQ